MDSIVMKREVRFMKCPKCQDELHVITFEGVDVDFCSGCKGIWFDEDEVAFAMELPEDIPQLADVQKQARQTDYECPRCGSSSMLEEMKFTPVNELLIDRCPQCKGIWLDNQEFPKLERIAAHIGDPKSKILLASKQLQAKGYQVLGIQK